MGYTSAVLGVFYLHTFRRMLMADESFMTNAAETICEHSYNMFERNHNFRIEKEEYLIIAQAVIKSYENYFDIRYEDTIKRYKDFISQMETACRDAAIDESRRTFRLDNGYGCFNVTFEYLSYPKQEV